MSVTLSPITSAEPITLDEAKTHLRIDGTALDDLISSLITATRQWCEDYQGRQYLTATRVLQLDEFPGTHHWHADHRHDHHWHRQHEIRLPYPPLKSITSVKYIDASGVEQTLAAAEYLVDATSEPGRIMPAYGESWPDTQARKAAVTITYVCGYGTADAVPAKFKAAMKLLIGHLYATPEAVSDHAVIEVPFGVKALLQQDMVQRWF